MMMSIVIMWFDNVDFNYDIEYLSSTVQPYNHMYQLMICLVYYLGFDLIVNPSNKIDTILHHIESIGGLSLALYGRNVGILNNCVRNEFSTIYLALATICSKSKNKFIKKISPLFMMLFVPTFVWYRIIPSSKMIFIIISNIHLFIFDTIDFIHFIFFLIHIILQYYWGFLILKKIKKMLL